MPFQKGMIAHENQPYQVADTVIPFLGSNVTQAAKGSSVTIKAQAHGGSGGDGRRYEYSFSYKAPSGGSYSTLRNFSQTSSVDFTLSETGTYIFRVLGRVADNSGNSPTITADTNFKSIGVSNTSTISSSAINVGESVTINASATGGNAYEYYYSVSTNGGSSYNPSTAQYVASASYTYKPSAEGTYWLRVIARDKSTGSTDEKVFSVTASTALLLNQCDVSSNNISISSKGQGVTLTFKADKGTAPYQYRCSYRTDNVNTDTYIYGDAASFASGKSSMQYVFTGIGTYKFKFEVRDSSSPPKTAAVTKTVNVTTNLTNTSTISGQKLNNRQSVSLNGSATGGTGEYEYKYSYQFPGSTEHITNYRDNAVDGWDLPNIISAENLDKNYTGTITFKIFVRDKNLKVKQACPTHREKILTAAVITITHRQGILPTMQFYPVWYRITAFTILA